MLAVKYIFANCRSFYCVKMSGDTIIYGEIVSKVLNWISQVGQASLNKQGKYTQLMLMENTFYMLDELTNLNEGMGKDLLSTNKSSDSNISQ